MVFMRPYMSGDHFEGFSPEPGKGLWFIATEGEKLVGWCRWRMAVDQVVIEEVVDSGDPQIFDGLVRGVLSMVNDGGIDRAVFSKNIRPDRLATSLISLDKNNALTSIDYFFNNCKKCKML